MNKSQQSQKQPSEICQINYKNEISIYSGELTKECISENLIKIKCSFPSLNPEFFTVFMDRIKDNGFSNQRLNDAVKYVIDNCIYPQPTIAQFLSFGKKVKMYNYTEYCDYVTANRIDGVELMKAVRVAGLSKPMYAMVSDIEMYGLELWNKTK